jgi:hypothetical protein
MLLYIKQNVKRILKNWRIAAILLLAAIFFIGTASYNYFAQQDNFVKFGSPDENANYVFAKLYGQTNGLTIFEKYNLYADDIMHPRSMRSDAGVIKPVSFLGMILIYGTIAKLTSYTLIPYLTPFFGAVGILFFYLLIKKIFGRRNAFISAFLLASFPVYIYYCARSMFHNVLFVVLLIIGLYFAALMVGKDGKETKSPIGDLVSLIFASLGGLFFGLAIITRTSELLWVLPMLLILWLFNIRKISITRLIIFLSFLFLSILPVFYWNQILYGHPLKGGYSEMNHSIANIANAGADLAREAAAGKLSHSRELLERVKNNIFYFGFKPEQSIEMFKNYFVRMFYWIFWPAVLGLLLFLLKIKKLKRGHWAYLFSYLLISLILIFYYGSWQFYDNPDPSRITIGNSYTRYWLPIYLGAIPFAGMFIIKLTRYTPFIKGGRGDFKKLFIASSRIIIITLIFILSMQFVLFGSEEGLAYSFNKHGQAKREFNKVLELTENNSVIITEYHDKLFFPERKVIVGLFDNKNMIDRYAKLIDYLPVYYYNFTFHDKDTKYLNDRRLREHGLGIEAVKQITSDFTLYKLLRRE